MQKQQMASHGPSKRTNEPNLAADARSMALYAHDLAILVPSERVSEKPYNT